MDIKNIKRDLLFNMYKTMYKIRKFEEAVVDFCLQGVARGAAHIYIGEEAVASGACHTLERTDYIVSTHRGSDKEYFCLFGKTAGNYFINSNCSDCL